MSKLKIAVLFGGCSPEYGVSLQSAAAVLRHMDQSRYESVMVGISQAGDWFRYRNLVITGIFTHLCTADVRTAEQEKYTMGQAAAFDRIICDLNKRGLNCGKIHLLSSVSASDKM